MDREHAARLLGRLHEAQGAFYAGGDAEPLRELLTDDVVWHIPGENAIAGDYEGIDAVLAYYTRRREIANRTFRLHPGEILTGNSDTAAVLTDGTATIAATEHRWSTIGLYRFRGDRVSECWLLALDLPHFNQIWSP